jgi:hypothetical protein
MNGPAPAARRSLRTGPFCVVALVLGFYFLVARPTDGRWTADAASSFYGWQTEGFLRGQLHLPIEPPQALLAQPDPYDPAANAPWRQLDASLYRGHYYSYFSALPTVLVFAPWRFVVGTHLKETTVTLAFMSLAFLVAAATLSRFRRDHCPDASSWTLGTALLACGLGNLAPTLIHGATYYQVPMACAQLWLMIALYSGVRAAAPDAPIRWLALASLALGLAAASRPNFVFATLALLPIAWSCWSRASQRPTRSRVLAAAALPIAACVALILWHNWARFDSPWEFGLRYQLSPLDFRHQHWNSLSHLGDNLAAILAGPVPLGRYYPFLDRNELQPLGFWPYFPATFACLGGAWWAWRATCPQRRAALPALLAALTLLFFLGTYFTLWLRYEVEVLIVVTFAAALISLGVDGALRTRLAQRLWRALFGAAVAVSVASTAIVTNPGWLSRPLAPLANLPAQAWEKLHGTEFGALTLEFQLPAAATPGQREPLVASGLSHRDGIFLEPAEAGRVRIGFAHVGEPPSLSEPLALDPAATHRLEIDAGFLRPPPEHPVFRDWPAAEIDRVRRQLEVRIDGQLVLFGARNFHASTPGTLRLGEGDGNAVAREKTFSGTLRRIGQAPLARPPATAGLHAASGAIALELQLPAQGVDQRWPLVSTGVSGTGDLIYLEVLPDGRMRLGHDNWGGGLWLTQPFAVDRSRVHRLVVQMAPLADARSDGAQIGQLRLIWNGEARVNAPRRFNSSRPAQNEIGVNAIRASTAAAFFPGRILSARPLTAAEWDRERRAAHDLTPIPVGPVRLAVRFTRTPEADAEPLLCAGESGRADFVFVQLERDGRVRFGLDHWGEGVTLSEPVAVDFAREHQFEIHLQSLYAPGATPPADGLRLSLDGRELLVRNGPAWPAIPAQRWLGLNPIGGSSCSARFSGEITILSETLRRD